MKRLAFIFFALMMLFGAQAKSYDLTICRYESEFFEADNDVYITLYTEDNVVTIRLDIIVEKGQQFFTNGKTYTWDNMLQKYCNAYVSADFSHYQLADATFTWRLDELGLEHFAGSAVDTLGNTYNFHYDVVPYNPTGDTIDVTFSQPLKLEHATDWYFSGGNDKFYLLMVLINDGDSPVGHYTNENIVMDFSYIERSFGAGQYEWYSFHHAEIDVTEAADDTLKIEALIAAQDTNVYRFHAFYIAPKAHKKVTINATDLSFDTDYLYGMVGAFKVEASDQQYEVHMAFSPMDEDLTIYGTYQISTYTPNIGYIVDYTSAEEETSEVYEGTVTIFKTDTGAVVTGKLLCYDNTEYTLNLSYAVPEKTREAEFIADGLELKLSDGAWLISGYNPDSTQYIALECNSLGIAGDYNIVTISSLYSCVVTDITWQAGSVDSYNYFDLVDANLHVEFDATDTIVTVTGTVVGQNLNDIPQFNVRLSNKPAKHEGVEQLNSSAATVKRMENNQIIIEKNGRKYTVFGILIQ